MHALPCQRPGAHTGPQIDSSTSDDTSSSRKSTLWTARARRSISEVSVQRCRHQVPLAIARSSVRGLSCTHKSLSRPVSGTQPTPLTSVSRRRRCSTVHEQLHRSGNKTRLFRSLCVAKASMARVQECFGEDHKSHLTTVTLIKMGVL